MEFKGTKREWSVIDAGGTLDIVALDDSGDISGKVVAELHVGAVKGSDHFNETLSNARLIAAAPELLEMLIKINKIENGAFGLKSFQIEKLKAEINEAINKALN